MKKRTIAICCSIVIFVLVIVGLYVSQEDNIQEQAGETEEVSNYFDDYDEELYLVNYVAGHDEQDTIVGNFTGKGIDTLYVSVEDCGCVYGDSLFETKYAEIHEKEHVGQWNKYYLRSPNPKIPSIELYGFDKISPKLVNEGDLDHNGTCEVGYLHTWMNSQFRYYRVLTLHNGEWRYLFSDDKLSSMAWFRLSGVDIVEPGPRKGTVKLNYGYEGYLETLGRRAVQFLDTIVVPTFDVIAD